MAVIALICDAYKVGSYKLKLEEAGFSEYEISSKAEMKIIKVKSEMYNFELITDIGTEVELEFKNQRN